MKLRRIINTDYFSVPFLVGSFVVILVLVVRQFAIPSVMWGGVIAGLAGMPKNTSAFSVDNFGRGAMGKEKYGRWLGVVYVDGEDVNEEMVRLGHARGYRDIDN